MRDTDWLVIIYSLCDLAVGFLLGAAAYRYFPEKLQWLF